MKKKLVHVEGNPLTENELRAFLLNEAKILQEFFDPATEHIKTVHKVLNSTIAKREDLDWDLWELVGHLNDTLYHIYDLIDCLESFLES